MHKVSVPIVVEVSRSLFQIYAAYRCIKIIKKLKKEDGLYDYDEEVSDDMKNLLQKQGYFEIFDLLNELRKSNPDWTSILHHMAGIGMCQGSLKHPLADRGKVICAIFVFANQFGAVGFNLYKLTKMLRGNKEMTKIVLILSLFGQIFYRFPIMIWIAVYQFLRIRKTGITPLDPLVMIPCSSIGLFLDYQWIKWSLNKLDFKDKKHCNSAMFVSIVFAVMIGRGLFK